ncbi:T9SS type A sorting domain-containing protein [Candidatus Marinimicrobia bacterium]|nr:T9SS type A sorting domain-containing protein [Candidatus Neomarinimicrobiota bacterium]
MKIMIICFGLSSIICGQNLKLFTLCEGNFGSANSSLWSSSLNGGNMHDIIHWDENSNPLGDIGQSMSIHETKLYLVMNNSHTIEVMNLAGGAYYENTLQLPNSSPRYITFNEDKGYISSWNFNAILILNLNNMEIVDTIEIDGKPEQMINYENHLYISVPNKSDWTTNDKVLKMRLNDNVIVETFTVEPGASMMAIHGSSLFVTSSSYDDMWNKYSGTSSIDLSSGEVLRYNAGQTTSYGSDIFTFQNKIYQIFDGGLVPLNEDLSPNISQKIGAYPSLYSADSYEEFLVLGISDYVAPDTVIVLDNEGVVLEEFIVSAIPGSFEFYNFDLASIEEQKIIPDIASIYNYPNPFNPTTIIQFKNVLNSPYRVYICDINGRKIKEFDIDSYQIGQKKIIWNAHSNSSGVYFAVFEQLGNSNIRKLSLIK